MEMDTRQLTRVHLESRSYRQLQQMAKSLGLPGNFKKIYLIELIIAKKYKTNEEVKKIIERVRKERSLNSKLKQNKQYKKIKLPQCRVALTKVPEQRNSQCNSPTITVTPKRRRNVRYSPEALSEPMDIVTRNRKSFLMRNVIEEVNIKNTVTNTSDRVLRSYNAKAVKKKYSFINNNIHEIQNGHFNTDRNLNVITNTDIQHINIQTTCLLRNITNTLGTSRPIMRQQFVIKRGGGDLVQPPLPTRRQRRISGIYPLSDEMATPSVCIRNRDGSRTPINAIIQKGLGSGYLKTKPSNVRDKVDVAVQTNTVPNYAGYPKYTNTVNGNVNCTLETLYNVVTRNKEPIVREEPAKTETVFVRGTGPIAAVVQSTELAPEAANITPPRMLDMDICQDDVELDPHDTDELLQASTPADTTDFSSSSTLDAIHSNSASKLDLLNMEDALEIIWEDKSFMSSVGKDTQYQCVLCDWDGNPLILDTHIRAKHADCILSQGDTEWNTTYTLQSLLQLGAWLHRIVEYDSSLYLLSAKCERSGNFTAALHLLSVELEPAEKKTISITVYNRTTDEPFSWTGHVPPFPSKAPYEIDENSCIKIDLAKLDMIPNSANLNDIHIIVFVKIF